MWILLLTEGISGAAGPGMAKTCMAMRTFRMYVIKLYLMV